MSNSGGETWGFTLGLWRLSYLAGQLYLWAFLPKAGSENKGILQLLVIL